MTRPPPRPASLPRRLAALLYDSLLLLAISWAVTALYLGVEVLLTGSSEAQFRHRPLLQVLLLASVLGFCCYFWTRFGQTLGMQSWRLKVQRLDGGSPDLRQCLLRCFGAGLSLACLGCGYWWALIDAEQRSWHDRLSGTTVVLLPKPGLDPDSP